MIKNHAFCKGYILIENNLSGALYSSDSIAIEELLYKGVIVVNREVNFSFAVECFVK